MGPKCNHKCPHERGEGDFATDRREGNMVLQSRDWGPAA